MENDIKKIILVVEDDTHIAEGLRLNLTLQNYDVITAEDGTSGLNKWRTYSPDLIILDIMLPALDGISVLRSIRLEDEKIPILILTAKGEDEDKIKGFTYGADDYMVKPFNLDEFLLRVDRLLIRSSWSENESIDLSEISDEFSTFSFGSNIIDFQKSVAHCKQGIITLTSQEIKLLKLLISNIGVPLSRKKLLQIGWGYAKGTTTRTIDNFIVRFRKYFEDNPKKPIYFKSIRSLGYLFEIKKLKEQ
ncbi:MAG: response regulator transcription factor [Desulfobacterales bacterium]|nr:response regulator transcription factor [Desulfobacterales bacterium]